MTNELKLCPFCGSERIFLLENYDNDSDGGEFSYECSDCNAQSSPAASENEALASWSKRASQTPWRPIEECDRNVCKEYMLRLRTGKVVICHISFRGISDEEVKKVWVDDWSLYPDEMITHFMELPALPDEVVS